MNTSKKCIRCMNSEAFCICPDDMTFTDKVRDVADRILNQEDQWFETYRNFLIQYFMSSDEDNNQNV